MEAEVVALGGAEATAATTSTTTTKAATAAAAKASTWSHDPHSHANARHVTGGERVAQWHDGVQQKRTSAATIAPAAAAESTAATESSTA